MKTLYLTLLLLFLNVLTNAQEVKPFTQSNTDTQTIRQTIATIMARVKQPSGDTAVFFIINKLVTHCGQDYGCARILYRDVMDALKADLHFKPVLPVARLSLKIAREHNDPELEADAYRNLAQYYEALGIQDSVDICIEKSMAGYEKAGMMGQVFKLKVLLVDRRPSPSSPASIRELEKLFEEAKQHGIRQSECYILTRLVNLTNQAGMLDKLAIYVSELEKRTVRPPDSFEEYNFSIYAANGRAALYLAETPKNWDKAKQSYLKALKWAEERPNPLFVVYILQDLSELEWERKDREMALRYVDEAIEKAEKWGLQSYLSTSYG